MSFMPEESDICAHCGFKGSPVLALGGHIFFEVILWLCYILPGVIYSVWRRARKKEVCPECGHPSMISAYSPRARQMMALANIDHASIKTARPKTPPVPPKPRVKKPVPKRK